MSQAPAGPGKVSAKRSQKRPQHRDYVLEVLGQQSFYGIFLRIYFWINKIARSLHGENKTDWQDLDQELALTGVQKMIMKNTVVYLVHFRDSLDKMMTLDIHDRNDFEWQSKVRVVWRDQSPHDAHSPEDALLVQCGGWQQHLGSEYLGSTPRIPLTPLTDRYFVYMASALRERSGVLFRCNQSHQYAGDVFEEFSTMCHMPFKSLNCNKDMRIGQLMQVINGAAMAGFWAFFEHLDSLSLVDFQIIMKEIQMVQQQYIIAEMTEQDHREHFSNRALRLHEDKQGAKAHLDHQREHEPRIANVAH